MTLVTLQTQNLTSTQDPRLTNVVAFKAGEGYQTYLVDFEGSPALLMDCGTLADFLDEHDDVPTLTVRVFETTADRDRYASGTSGPLRVPK